MSASLHAGLIRLARSVPEARPFVNQIIRPERHKYASPFQRRLATWLTAADEERRVTPESEAWARDEEAREQHLKAAAKAFVPLFKQVKATGRQLLAEVPGDTQNIRDRRRAKMRKRLRAMPALQEFLDKYVGELDMHPDVAQARKSAFEGLAFMGLSERSIKQSWKKTRDNILLGYQVIEMARVQEGLRAAIPDDIRRFLPTNLVVEVDDDGVIGEVTDRFVNEYETMAVKRRRQRQIIEKYNDIVGLVKKDMRGQDPRRRLAAIITSIIMETGIRPAQAGNAATVQVDGEKVKVDTFGATTLKMKHLRDIRNNFLTLDFTGKMAKRNLAEVSNRELIKAMKSLIRRASKDFKTGGDSFGEQSLFTLPDGKNFSYGMLRRYFKNNAELAGLKITDFRKLKATETILDNLHSSQEALHAKIREFVDDEVEDLKERVAEEIAKVVREAYLNAQSALSHSNVDVTIRAYANPEVLLRFLSRGGIEGRLKEAVMQGRDRLAFNVDKFIENAMQGGGTARTASFLSISRMLIASERFMSLGDLLEKIEDDIEIRKTAMDLGELLDNLEEDMEEDEANLNALV